MDIMGLNISHKRSEKFDSKLFKMIESISDGLYQQSTYDSFLDLLLGIRKAVSTFFDSFEYTVWFYDKTSAQKDEILFSVFNSASENYTRRDICNITDNKSSLCRAYNLNKIEILDSHSDDPFDFLLEGCIQYLHVPISIGDEKTGVLTIFLFDDEANNPIDLKNTLEVFSIQLFLTIKIFFFSLERSLFNSIKKLQDEHIDSHKNFIDNFVRLVSHKIPCAGCSIFIYDKLSDQLSLEATTGLYGRSDESLAYRLGEGLTGWVAKEQKPLRLYNIDDPVEVSRVSDNLKWSNKYSEIKESEDSSYREWKSFLAIPIFSKDRNSEIFGVLRLSKRTYGECFLPCEQTIANDLSKFLSNYYHNKNNELIKNDFIYFNKIQTDFISTNSNPTKFMRKILQRINY
jgi:hypothetical protein